MTPTVTPTAHRATTALFLVSGLSFGGFVVRSAALKVEHGLDDRAYGLTSVLFGAVAIATMQALGPLLRRVGPEAVARVAVVALPLAVALLGAVPGTAGYVAAIAVVAAANGALDVAMNATAVRAEQRIGRPILSGCHAAWSIGITVATLAGTASLAASVPTAAHLAAAACVAVPVALAAGTRLPRAVDGEGPQAITSPKDDAPPSGSTHGRPAGPVGSRSAWSPAFARVAVVGVVLMVAEGAALAWGAVLLHEQRGATLAVAAAATTAFTAAQTLGRLVGDRLRAAWGDARLFRRGAVVGACGLALGALAPDPVAAVAGFALLGLGGATLVPIAYAETGRLDPSGRSAARLSVFVYAGVLAGPAAIGLVAAGAGLTAAVALVAPLLAASALVLPGSDTSRAHPAATTAGRAPS
ncbi:MFS transporter [Cellulomonas sp. H30R-01]|uniref:MFS transporter n=1 Tax=Cellulomonas sp. H30R-01 TaxID=2704467 RepID=UPI00138C141D|nr:MFS transporter [Cellulomonas sp. H30R-01]QHT57838.1 MFS transporter [Cellulomonas sp. H30R-01]